MADATEVATPPTAETTTPDETPIAGAAGAPPLDIDAALAAIGTEPEAPAADPAQETTDETPPAEPPAEDPFSEKSLSTPAGIAAARKLLRAEQVKWADKHTANERKGRKLAEQTAAFKADKQTFALAKQQFDADVAAVMRGDGKTRLEALARLSKMPAHAVYEDISLAIMGMGKAPPKADPAVQALKDELQAKLDEVSAKIKEREEREKSQSEEQSRTAWFREEVGKISTLLPKYPLVKAWAEDDAAAVTDRIFSECVRIARDTGKPPSYEDVIAAENRRLLDRYNRAQAGIGGAPKGGTDPATVTNKPATAQRPPGQTVTQAAATQQQSVRPMTEHERLRRLAEAPDLGSLLGLE